MPLHWPLQLPLPMYTAVTWSSQRSSMPQLILHTARTPARRCSSLTVANLVKTQLFFFSFWGFCITKSIINWTCWKKPRNSISAEPSSSALPFVRWARAASTGYRNTFPCRTRKANLAPQTDTHKRCPSFALSQLLRFPVPEVSTLCHYIPPVGFSKRAAACKSASLPSWLEFVLRSL